MERVQLIEVFKDEFDGVFEENCLFLVKVRLERLPIILAMLRAKEGVLIASVPSSRGLKEHRIVVTYDKRVIDVDTIKNIIKGAMQPWK